MVKCLLNTLTSSSFFALRAREIDKSTVTNKHFNSKDAFYLDLLVESFIINEDIKLNSYFEKDYRLSYLATKNHAEIDLLLSKANSHIAVEIKSGDKVNEQEVKSLLKISNSIKNIKKVFYVSNDPIRKTIENAECLHWKEFKKL